MCVCLHGSLDLILPFHQLSTQAGPVPASHQAHPAPAHQLRLRASQPAALLGQVGQFGDLQLPLLHPLRHRGLGQLSGMPVVRSVFTFGGWRPGCMSNPSPPPVSQSLLKQFSSLNQELCRGRRGV